MSITEVLLTGRVILIAWISCFAIGLPVMVLGASYIRARTDARDVWLYSPFVGAAAIILICQNLLYLGVTSGRSAVIVWILTAAGWGWLLSSASRRALLRPLPWLAFGLGAMVYLVHGAGLLQLGASHYYGYGWYDMFNYVSNAQFFADFPFHAHNADQTHLAAAQIYKSDRIGQSVLHAFLMVSSGVDAQQSFGTTILLAPLLLFFALLTVARRLALPPVVGYLAALAGALSPAVATVHLESFFSQAMCLPFLVLWPVAVARLTEAPGWRTALTAGLLLAVILSVYTETMPIVLCIAIACCVAKDAAGLAFLRTIFSGRFHQFRSTRYPFPITFGWLLLAIAVGILASIGFLSQGLGIFFRSTSGAVLTDIYPWAFREEGLARLWVGNQVTLQSKWVVWTSVAVIVAMIAVNLVTMANYAKHRFSIFFMAFALTMLIPLGPLLAGMGAKYGYQFYKLLLMAAPLHAFWFVVGTDHLRRSSPKAARYAPAFGALLVAVNGFFVLGIANASAKASTVGNSSRGGAHLLIDADFRQLRDVLAAISDRDVLNLWFDNDLGTGSFRAAWIDYFARNNRVVSINSSHSAKLTVDAIYEKLFPGGSASHGSPLVVTWVPLNGMAQQLVFSNDKAFIYEARSAGDVRQLFAASRVTSSRTLKLDAIRPFDAESWFPVWIGGMVNSQSLLTMKFGALNTFRYDQWGYPAVHLAPGGDCKGREMTLTVQFLQLEKRLRLICNGVVAEADVPLAFTALDNRGTPRFGWNFGIGSLEGKYPLAAEFPGSVVELLAVGR